MTSGEITHALSNATVVGHDHAYFAHGLNGELTRVAHIEFEKRSPEASADDVAALRQRERRREAIIDGMHVAVFIALFVALFVTIGILSVQAQNYPFGAHS